MPSVINIASRVESMDPSRMLKKSASLACLRRAHHRNSSVPKWFFRNLRAARHQTGRYRGNSDSSSAKDL